MQWRLVVAFIFIALAAILPRSLGFQKSVPRFSLPAAAAIGPGVGIGIDYDDGSGGIFCTAGFLVRTSTGKPGFLTAGHCDQPGGPGDAAINYSKTGNKVVGRFAETVRDGTVGEDHDIALVLLDGTANIPLNSAITGSTPVTGVNTRLAAGDYLCKFGVTTGKRVCGPIVEITPSKVRFLAAGAPGDSGGPVYSVHHDGTASAVGINFAHIDVDYSRFGGTLRRFAVAELIQPWLEKRDLTLLTTPG